MRFEPSQRVELQREWWQGSAGNGVTDCRRRLGERRQDWVALSDLGNAKPEARKLRKGIPKSSTLAIKPGA